MKKPMMYLLGGLVILALLTLLFIRQYRRLSIDVWDNVSIFSTYNKTENTAVVVENDAKRLKAILNNKHLYHEEHSCGFSDDFGLSISGRILWIASDGCPYIYDCESGRYLTISKKDRQEILDLFSKYGLRAPKY